jgi:hypothetical protein
VCRFPKYSYYWNLLLGRNVPFFATRIQFVCVVSQFPTSVHHDWARHHVSFSRAKLVEPDSSAFDRQPGTLLCSWGSAVLQSCDCVYGRMVCGEERLGFWDHVGKSTLTYFLPSDLIFLFLDRFSSFRASADSVTGWDGSRWRNYSPSIAVPIRQIRLSHYPSHLVHYSFCSHPSLDLISQAASSRCASHQPPKI